jgi:hypothetical protein
MPANFIPMKTLALAIAAAFPCPIFAAFVNQNLSRRGSSEPFTVSSNSQSAKELEQK